MNILQDFININLGGSMDTGELRDFLEVNRHEYFKGEYFTVTYGIKKSRLQAMIKKLRDDGIPICGDFHKGYKYDFWKINLTIASLRGRAKSMLRTARRLEKRLTQNQNYKLKIV